jgi:uncharacterized protein (UPF0332 family)
VDYLQKAKEQFRAGRLLFENGYYNDALSRLYYALRSIAIFVVGKPGKGKWKHSALLKRFVMEVDGKKLFELSRRERKLIKDFARVRELADYELVEYPEEKVKEYIVLVERIIKEVENAKTDHKT